MKRKDVEQLATATPDELRAKLDDLTKRIQSMTMDRAVGKVKNLHEIQFLKKDVARVMTFLNMKHD